MARFGMKNIFFVFLLFLVLVGILLISKDSSAKVYRPYEYSGKAKVYTLSGKLAKTHMVNKIGEQFSVSVFRLNKPIKIKDSTGDISYEYELFLCGEGDLLGSFGKTIKLKGEIWKSLSAYTPCKYNFNVKKIVKLPAVNEQDSLNEEAGNALADAIESGDIEYDETMNFNIADMDGDGVKDILFSGFEKPACVYLYKQEKIYRVTLGYPEHTLVYNYNDNMFYESGEGGGGWVYLYKLIDYKLDWRHKYTADWENGIPVYKHEINGGETKKITAKKYNSICSEASEYYHDSFAKEDVVWLLRSSCIG